MQPRRMTTAGPLVAALFLFMATHAAAQGAPANPYRPNAADEDWTFLKTTPKTDVWDRLKYVALGPEDWSLSFSGEFRLRPEGFRTRETAARAGTIDSYRSSRLRAAGARISQDPPVPAA